MSEHAVWIEAERWARGEWDPADGNTDVRVRLADGSVWVATFFTYQNVTTLRDRYRQTGECLRGGYLWASDMVLVDEVSRERIEQVVAHLIGSDELRQVFRRDDSRRVEGQVVPREPKATAPR